MTKHEVIVLCIKLKELAFCQLLTDKTRETVSLTKYEYDREMRRDRRWCTPGGEGAWYQDEESEALQDAWYKAAREARQVVREWEAAHKGKIPQWAKSL